MKCLIIDEMHKSILPMLEQIGIRPVYDPNITRAEIEECISEYEAILVRSKINLDKVFFQKARALKFIARAGAGMDKIDLDELAKKNIEVFNAPEGNSNAVAEHCLGMLLSLTNNLFKGKNELLNNVWDREGNRGFEIANKTLGVIGFGHMGKAFSDKMHTLGCKVLAYDRYKNGFSDSTVLEASMQQIAYEADILSIHIPKNNQNIKFIDEAFLESFRKPIWLLNTARGEVLDTDALVKGLKNGRIKGAGLDVFENEKLETMSKEQRMNFNFLIKSNNVIMSPHVAGWTHESYQKINEVLIGKISNWLESKNY